MLKTFLIFFQKIESLKQTHLDYQHFFHFYQFFETKKKLIK